VEGAPGYAWETLGRTSLSRWQREGGSRVKGTASRNGRPKSCAASVERQYKVCGTVTDGEM